MNKGKFILLHDPDGTPFYMPKNMVKLAVIREGGSYVYYEPFECFAVLESPEEIYVMMEGCNEKE